MSNSKVGWHFPSSGGGAEAGFNDSGIQTFAGKPFASLAREIIQNSLDARKTKSHMVTVAFQLETITDLPGRKDLLKTMEKCLKESKGERKSEEFFKNAVKILKADEIVCLKVLDYNTTGLRDGKQGEVKSGQWHRLVKTTGRSTDDNSMGGSFGIGKNAPFAVSGLRTVFYSTRYMDENGSVCERAQGKAILISHPLSSGDYSQAVGFYGQKAQCARFEGKKIPELLRRQKEDGTTLLIPGLRKKEKWQEKIIAAVISNYFLAIHAGDLEVRIDHDGNSKYGVINAETLPGLLADPNIQKIDEDGVKAAHDYCRALSSEPKESELPTLGHCILWILAEEGCPKSVAVMRRGMKITESVRGLKRWDSCADFVAVCVCDSEKGQALLRQMENPAHDNFEPERLEQHGEDVARGKKALDELSKWIREEVKKVAESGLDEITSLEKMAEFLPRHDDNLPGEKNNEKDFDGGSCVVLRPVPVKPEKADDIHDEEDGPGDEEGDFSGDGSGGDGGGGTSGGEGEKVRAGRPMKFESVRVLPLAESETDKQVMFTPKESGVAVLTLKIAGDSFVEDIGISEVLEGQHDEVVAGQVSLAVAEGERVKLAVRLAEPTNDALSVTLSQPKEGEG